MKTQSSTLPASHPFAQHIINHTRAHVQTINGQDWVGLGHISRDQYTGIFYGLGQVIQRMPIQAAPVAEE